MPKIDGGFDVWQPNHPLRNVINEQPATPHFKNTKLIALSGRCVVQACKRPGVFQRQVDVPMHATFPGGVAVVRIPVDIRLCLSHKNVQNSEVEWEGWGQ